MILVCSKKGDDSAERVDKILQEDDKDVFHLHLDDYLSYEPVVSIAKENSVNKIKVDLSQITAIYYRTLVFPYLPNSEMPEMYRNFLSRELIAMFLGQLLSLSVRWVNHPFYSHLANYKVVQLEKARAVGFNLPDTCIATLPKTLFDFYKRKKDKGLSVVTKAIHLGYVQSRNPDEDEIVFTQNVEINSAEEIPKDQPLLFQEKIEPDYEIRCFIVGDLVLAVKVESLESYSDYREIDSSLLKAEAIALPEIQRQSCLLLTKNFNLEYSAIDLIFKDEKYFFIDFNPTGEWLWYEEHTDLPISHSIAHLLRRNELSEVA